LSDNVRVRFAPSPTGHLHIGGARTAIYNWAYARRMGGTFILRIDDTDPERSTEENMHAILRGMRWLGLDWDEGPEVGGDHGPYFQTQRFASYAEALETLKARDAVYPCFCTADELAQRREAARSAGGFAGYDRRCRSCAPDEAAARVAAGEPAVWRIAVPEDRGDITFTDPIRGELSFPSSAMDDFVLVRSDGTPTYNFATVIDDDAMEITHVVRGDDHLSNTPRQILVFEALGHQPPVFAHLPMIWGADGKRLSKRHGATSVESYRDMGYLPEALLNYLALLGWSLDGETTIIDATTLTENFDFSRVSSNPAIFDVEKLEWMNGVYLRELTSDRFVDHMLPWLEAAELITPEQAFERRPWLLELAPLISERVKRLDEIVPMVRFLFTRPEIEPAAREKVLDKAGARSGLEAAHQTLADLVSWQAGAIEDVLRAVPEATGLKPSAVFQAVRVAVAGTTVSPPLFESLALLGREETLARVAAAVPLAAE
jgi:glutamyl-tRNA synthetase